MSTWGTARARIATALAALAVLACAPAAHAASGPAAVTVTACKGDAMTLLARVKPTGKAARKARGAKLQMRFSVLPLFGLPQRGAWRDFGTKKTATGSQSFSSLGADSWIGVIAFRFRKGSKTVLSGSRRSEAVKIGSTRGRAFCTLEQGFRVLDKTPPELFPVPSDDLWYRGPARAWVVAKDEYPGVARVFYRIDGGPVTDIRNGEAITITAEGSHTIDWGAADVDGNTAFRTVVLHVDAAAPTKPQLQRPASATANTKPTFQWTPSSDSGSGLRGYLLTINRASDGAQVAQASFDANTTSGAPASLQDNVAYTAVVTAVDNTSDGAFTTSSDPLSFRVDTTPEVTGSDPGAGAVLTGSRKDGNLTVTLDRPADPASVSNNTVVLDRNSESGSDPAWTTTCSSPCNTITVDPSGTLPEGRYTLSVNNVKTEEGIGFPAFSVSFAVPFFEDPSGGSANTGGTCTGATLTSNEAAVNGISANVDEGGRVDYDWSVTGGGSGGLRVLRDGTKIAESSFTSGSGHDSLAFTLSSGSHAYTIQYYATCAIGESPTTFNAGNVVATRNP